MLDPMLLAVASVLGNTRLPRVVVDENMNICFDASDEGLHSHLSVSRQIVSVSCGVYVDADGSAVLLVDPSDEEVAGVHATVTVAADQDGQVCHVSQSSGRGISQETVINACRVCNEKITTVVRRVLSRGNDSRS